MRRADAERAGADRRPRRALHARTARFGVTGEAGPLDPEVVEAVEDHRFAPLRKLQWRNAELDFGSPAGADRQPRGADGPPRPDAGPRGRRPRDPAHAVAAMPEVARPRRRRPRRARCCGTSARSPTSARSSPAEHARLARRHLRLPARRRPACPTDWLAAPDRPHRPDRRRHRRAVEAAGVYPHLDLRRAASRLGRRRGPLARRDPCGRRPAVGRAARAADPAVRRPPHQRC